MSYEVGDLELSFKTFSSDTINSINATTKALRSLNTQIKKVSKIDMRQTYQAFNQLTRVITPFIDKIASASEPLRNFSNALDVTKINNQLDLTQAKIEKLNASTTLLNTKNDLAKVKVEQANLKLEKTKTQLDSIKKKSDSADSSFKSLFNIGKIYFFINYTKRLAQAMGKIVSNAIDFQETLNKFNVSFGTYSNEATKYINQLTYAFNLSSESIMDYMSTFNNMLSTIGNLSRSDSLQLSSALTSMAVDYASLFNTSIDTAMEQFQSTLSGQIRSIRTTSGVDVSDTTLYEFYQGLGGTKTIGNLTQIEKRLLRIYAIQQQLNEQGAIGDFERTADKTANMLKQISQTLKEASTYLGSMLLKYIEPLVRNTLAVSIAVRDILKSFAEAKGVLEDTESVATGLFGGIEESAENAEESINGIINSMLGFDKLNVLGSETQTGQTNDLTKILTAIQSYSSTLNQVSTKARSIADDILTWLGFTKSVNEETKDTVWTLGEGETRFNRIKLTLEAIGGIVGSLILTKVLTNTVDKFGKISVMLGKIGKKLAGIPAPILAITAVVAVLVATFVHLYNTNEEFRNSINELVAEFKEKMQPTMESLKNTFDSIHEAIKPFLDWLMETALPKILEFIASSILDSLTLVMKAFDYIAKAVNIVIETISILVDTIKLVGMALTGAFAIMGGFVKGIFTGDFSDLENAIDNIIPTIQNKMSDLANNIGEKFNQLWENLKEGGKAFVNFFISALNVTIKGLNKMTTALSGAWTWIGIPAIPDIPEIPKLAKGGVAKQSTLVNIGEYANAKQNPEIVSPQSLMRETFMEAVMPLAQAILSGNKEVIQAIEDKDTNMYINGRKVSENIYNDLKSVSARKGDMLFSK